MSLGDNLNADPELLEFLEIEKQRAVIQEAVHKMTGTCWDMCVDKPKDKLDGRSENCITNCVGRSIDVLKLIQQRFNQKMQKGQ